MQTLVICIDRDNDLGVKANVQGPLIGKEANIEAAVKLATADPEDSDTNTIFGGVKILDELLARGIDAEIITLAGDKNIGILSDQKIANQLDIILKKIPAESAIFVSDGAEDETLLPIVQSRIKIDSVRRIVVMQSANLESTYYIIKHAFNDPKISQTFFVPVGLAALIYAFFLLIDYSQGAIIGILAAVGLYMLYRGFSDTVDLFLERLKESFNTGRLTFFTYAAAGFFIVIGTILGMMDIWALYTAQGIWYYGLIPLLTAFIHRTVWIYAFALLFADSGKIFDSKRRGKPVGKYLIPAFFILSIGCLFWGASSYLMSMSSVLTGGGDPRQGMEIFVYSIVFAVILALSGIKISTLPGIAGKK